MAIEATKERATTLEERLTLKFDELQEAREDNNLGLFDEIAKSIEILFKGLPTAYNMLMQAKNELEQQVTIAKNETLMKANQAQDEISKQHIIKKEFYDLEQEQRDLYEEIIMEVLQRYNLILFKSISTPESYAPYEEPELIPEQSEQSEQQPVQYVPEEQPVPEQVPEPVQQEKKPRLLKRKESFDV